MRRKSMPILPRQRPRLLELLIRKLEVVPILRVRREWEHFGGEAHEPDFVLLVPLLGKLCLLGWVSGEPKAHLDHLDKVSAVHQCQRLGQFHAFLLDTGDPTRPRAKDTIGLLGAENRIEAGISYPAYPSAPFPSRCPNQDLPLNVVSNRSTAGIS